MQQEMTLPLDKVLFSTLSDIPQFNNPDNEVKLRLTDLNNENLKVEILIGENVEWTHDSRNEHVALKLMKAWTPEEFNDQEIEPKDKGDLLIKYDSIIEGFTFNNRYEDYINNILADSGNRSKIVFHPIKRELKITYKSYVELFKTLIIIGAAGGKQDMEDQVNAAFKEETKES